MHQNLKSSENSNRDSEIWGLWMQRRLEDRLLWYWFHTGELNPKFGLQRRYADLVDQRLVNSGLVAVSPESQSEYLKYQERLVITAAGKVQAQAVIRNRTSGLSSHDALVHETALWWQSHGTVVWENIQFDAPAFNSYSLGKGKRLKCRPDVYAIEKTLTKKLLSPVVFEIKVSRKDFEADLADKSKRQAYAAVAEKVFYVCPIDLIHLNDVPEGCGLIWKFPGLGFDIKKQATRKAIPINAAHVLSLAIRPGSASSGVPDTGSRYVRLK